MTKYLCIICCSTVFICTDGHFPLGEKLCIGWATMDVLMCTASIWHMATISVDRYCSIRFPLRYRRTKSPLFVVVKIAFVWVVSVGICSSLAVTGLINPSSVYHGGQCAPAVTEFVIYGSIVAFYVPLLVMFVTYALTVKTLSRNNRTIATTRKHTSAVFHVERPPRPIIRSITISSVSNGENHRQSLTASPSTNSKVVTKSQISITEPDMAGVLGKCTEAYAIGNQTNSYRDDGKGLHGALSMPELISIVGSLPPVHYTASQPALVVRAATSSKNTNDNMQYDDDTDNDNDAGKQGRSTDVIATARALDDDDTRRPLTDTCCRNRANVTSVVVDSELRHNSTTSSTVNSYCASHVDDETRHNGDADDDVTSRRHRTSSETVNNATPSTASTPVPLHTCIVPNKVTAWSCNMNCQMRGQSSMFGNSKHTKRKATRVLGVMFVVFVVMWTPFFLLNVLSAVCPDCVQSVAPSVWTVLVWLGWVSSFANPIIYTSFSPAFRAAFKRLLTCRRLHVAKRQQHQQHQQLWVVHRHRQSSTSSS